MFKLGVKTYLTKIYHFFTLLGFAALAGLIGFFIVVPIFKTNLTSTGNQLVNILSSEFTKEKAQEIVQQLGQKVQELNWADPLGAIQTLLSPEWIKATLESVIGPVSEELTQQITDCVNAFTASTKGLIINVVLGIFGGIVIGYIVLRVILHFELIGNKSLFRFIISLLFSLILLCGSFIAIYFLSPKYPNSQWIIIAITLFLTAFVALFAAWFCYGKGQLKFKQVVNLGSMTTYIIVILAMFALSACIFTLFNYCVNPTVALLLELPLYGVTFILCDCTAYTYVDYANRGEVRIISRGEFKNKLSGVKDKHQKIRNERKQKREAKKNGENNNGTTEN